MKSKAVFIILLGLAAFFSCGLLNNTYKYSYIRPSDKKLSLKSYTVKNVEVFNAEALFLDRQVVSNTISQVFDVVMGNNGFVQSQDNDMTVNIKVFIEENDIINNRQTLSIFMTFMDKLSPFAQFIISSKTKDIILDKATLISEMDDIIKQIKNL